MLQINELWTNETKGYICGESGWYEPYTDNIGRLFRSLQKEYGRCVSKMYQDTPDGTADQIGWVFQKTRRYEDTGQPYIAETWIHLRHVK